MLTAVLVAVIASAACGPLGKEGSAPAAPEGDSESRGLPASIISAERSPLGVRLVLIAETGARLADLTEIGPVPVRDGGPAWSPDGRWVVFVSSRGRSGLAETSLWCIEARIGAQPRRLTTEPSVDRDPVWTPDGRAVIFSSNRGGSFDLWRLELDGTRYGTLAAAGEPIQLTRDPGQEFSPSVAPDGERIAFAGLDESGRIQLRIWADGVSTALTEGPADTTPAWSPDGETIAFAAPAPQDHSPAPGTPEQAPAPMDLELYTVRVDGSERRLLVREPLADQTGPVWSADGRYVFATSIYRSVASGKPVLASITFVDLRESPVGLRALHDPVAVESRVGIAVDKAALDHDVLHRASFYKEALKRVLERELSRRRG